MGFSTSRAAQNQSLCVSNRCTQVDATNRERRPCTGAGHGPVTFWFRQEPRPADRGFIHVFHDGRLQGRPLAALELLLVPLHRRAKGRVFDPNGDQHTTSEGQAYALFFALADNDRPTFDRVLAWTETNLAGGDLTTHLPAWLWGKDKDGQWKVLDPNSASDADVWMAYTLLEAGRLWNSKVDTDLGRGMLALIASKEVANLPGFGPMLVPGPAGFQHDKTWILNPSYLPVFLFERFAALDPAGPWQQIALGIPAPARAELTTGYAMDWVEYVPGDGFYPVPKPSDASQNGPNAEGPGGSYDAIRVYLWAGMIDPHDPSREHDPSSRSRHERLPCRS